MTQSSPRSSFGLLAYWRRCRKQDISIHYLPQGLGCYLVGFLRHKFLWLAQLANLAVFRTSASIYYMVHEFDAFDWCGQSLGPYVTSFVHSYALSEVSTLLPYANANATTRMGPPSQLQLSDLRTDCSTWETIPIKNMNTMTDGCNAIVEYKEDIITALAKKM
jgi:hypothetical protein